MPEHRETQLYAHADLHHYTRRMFQALDAYWLHYDGLPKGRHPRGRYELEDWWNRFEKYREFVEWMLLSD